MLIKIGVLFALRQRGSNGHGSLVKHYWIEVVKNTEDLYMVKKLNVSEINKIAGGITCVCMNRPVHTNGQSFTEGQLDAAVVGRGICGSGEESFRVLWKGQTDLPMCMQQCCQVIMSRHWLWGNGKTGSC